ncbi:MAG TPA: MarR family transcriptional regulator [Erythrobacter sp.]
MDLALANILGALSMAVMDRIEEAARDVLGRSGETPAALIVIGYGQGITNDRLCRILGLSHSGAVRLVDRLVADELVERRRGRDARETALHLTQKGAETRRALLCSRLSTVNALLDVLSDSEQSRLEALVRNLLARQATSEGDRYRICRLCDAAVCERCPLPTGVRAPA